MIFLVLVLLTGSLYGEKYQYDTKRSIAVTRQMIEGKKFYSRFGGDEFYTLSEFKKIDPVDLYGEVTYIMMDSPRSISGSAETVSYKIVNGTIMIYGNDGSASRLSLVKAGSDRWILLEENDVIGDGRQFKLNKNADVWFFKKPKGYPPLEKCKPVDMECFVKTFKFRH